MKPAIVKIAVIAGLIIAFVALQRLSCAPRPGATDPESRASRPDSIPTHVQGPLDAVAAARGGADALATIGTVMIRGEMSYPGAPKMSTTIYTDIKVGKPRIYYYTETPVAHRKLSLVDGESIEIKKPGVNGKIEKQDEETTQDLDRMARGLYAAARFPSGDAWTQIEPLKFKRESDGAVVELNDRSMPRTIILARNGTLVTKNLPEIWTLEGSIDDNGIVYPKNITARQGERIVWSLESNSWNGHVYITDGFFLGKSVAPMQSRMIKGPASQPGPDSKPK